MYCDDVSASAWARIQCSNRQVPSDLCKHYRDWVLPPANDTLGGGSAKTLPPHLETFKLMKPEATHFTTLCCIETKNTTFSNVIMLVCVSLKLVRCRLFSLRRGGNSICICVSLCGVVMPQSDLIFVSLFVFGASWEAWAGVKSCHITPVFWLLAQKVCPPLHPSLNTFWSKPQIFLFVVLRPIGQGLLSLLCYQKRGSTGCKTPNLQRFGVGGVFFLFFWNYFLHVSVMWITKHFDNKVKPYEDLSVSQMLQNKTLTCLGHMWYPAPNYSFLLLMAVCRTLSYD